MQRDFWSTFSILSVGDSAQRQALDALLGSGQPPDELSHLTRIADSGERVQLLAQALATQQKDYARTGTRQTPGGLARFYRKEHLDKYLESQRETYLKPLGLLPALPDLSLFPAHSFALHFTLILRKPYLSRDDATLHILDNPVKKDKVFHSPMVASTSWKGSLRAAMVQHLAEWWSGLSEEARQDRNNRKKFVARRAQMGRLFGTERDVQVDDTQFNQYMDKLADEYLARWYRRYVRRFLSPMSFYAGRLHFFPTFFAKIGLEVINPHDRRSSAGQQPIYFECVPEGAQGDFALLYVPLDSISTEETAADLEALAEGIQGLLTTYGFGAKTSSGFGLAEDRLAGKGTLALRAELPGLAASTGAASEPEQSAPDLPRYLESPTRLHDDFRRPDGSLKSEAEYEAFLRSRGGLYGKKDKQLYEKAQKWWEREGRQLAKATAQEPTSESANTPPVTELTFGSLSDLLEQAQGVAAQLRKRGER